MNSKHQVTFRQTKEDRRLLESLTKKSKLSISELVRRAVKESFKKNYATTMIQ